MSIDILPDSRTRERHGSIRSPQGNLIPIHCAQCGKPWGMVPEEYITFAFALCDPCSETMGAIANTYQEPDHIFWKRIQEAQLEENISSVHELTKQLDDPNSVMSKLAREWQKHAFK